MLATSLATYLLALWPALALPPSFLAHQQAWRAPVAARFSKRLYTKLLIADHDTYLHAHYKANHTHYYPLASLALSKAGTNYTTGQNLLAYVELLSDREPGVTLLSNEAGFVGSLNCQSK